MKHIARDLLGRARAIESRIARTVEGAAQRVARSDHREPLEIAHAVLDVVETQVQPAGRGRQVFPFNVVTVIVVAATREARARHTAVLEGEPTMRQRIVERLESMGCPADGLSVAVTFAPRAKANWLASDFHVVFDRSGENATAPINAATVPPTIELSVLHGHTDRRAYAFTQQRIDVGRCAEVLDARERLLRTNHLAFADSADPIDQSVSRQHAHIALGADGEYRLHDDRSAHGTGIVRNGRTVVVPAGTRGVRLQTGDEVVLGRARLRVRIASPVRERAGGARE
jgi:hypothetical protein